MFKKLIIILIFSLTPLKAQIISQVQITGNQRISEETIKVYGDIEIGKDYTNNEINNILKKLYETEFFEDVNILFESGLLKISLKEYPVINDIKIEGEKSKSIVESILEKLSLKSRSSFISNKLNDDINMIKKYYASGGYNFATIKTKVENFDNNRINLVYNVEKGKRSFIKNIVFVGDKKIRDSRLRDIIVSEEKKFWKFLSKNTFYNNSNIELDKRLLTNYYKSLGYYDVQVLSNSAEIDAEQNYTKLTYTINAGKRFKISKISSNISDVIKKDLFLPLEKFFSQNVGKYYSPFKVKKLLDEVDIIISNNDLQFVEHSVNEVLVNENVQISINIYEGKKETVERIKISGNSVTEESVIRSALLIDEGDPFNNLKLDQSIAKLKSKNIFGEVSYKISEGSKKDQKKVEIIVEEKPTGEIGAGAGVGTEGGSFSFLIKENNWLGKGIGLSTNVDASSQSFSGGISVTNPNFDFSGNALTFFAQNTKNDRPESGYENNTISTGVGIKFEQYKDVYIAPKLSFSYDTLKVDGTASASLKKQKGTFSDLSFDYDIISDKRDRAYGPTDGYLIIFNQALPVYADAPYIKNSFSLNNYKSLTPNIISAFKIYGSAITGLQGKDVRLSKRLNLSSTRLRGFESGKIGPKDGADYVGGNYALSSSLEFNLPNLLPESTKTDVSIFLDAGNLWHVDYDSSIDNSNKIRSSLGLNTNWTSPVGPMSFILSKNISKADTDVTQSFNFRLGTTF